MRILEGIFKDIGQCLNHLVYRGGLMCIFHCLEIQGLQGVEQKMGINLQLKGCHLSQLLFLLLQSQLAAKEGLVQKELNQVVRIISYSSLMNAGFLGLNTPRSASENTSTK